jgi:hypothetical protein
MQFTPQLVVLGLIHLVATKDGLDLVFTNFSRVSTLLADVGDVRLVPAIRLLSLKFLWIYIILRRIVCIATVNMHYETVTYCSVFFLIRTACVCVCVS